MKKRRSEPIRNSIYSENLTESEMGNARKVVHRSPHRTVGLIACTWIQPEPVEYESQLERRFVQRALLFPGVRRIIHQPFTLNFTVEEKRIDYTPDFLIAFGDSTRIVIEVKPLIFVSQHETKLRAAAEYLSTAGDQLMVVTDGEIDVGQVPDNVALLLRYARSPIDSATQSRCMDAANNCTRPIRIGPLAKAAGVAHEVILCLIGRGVFSVDLESAIDANTEILIQKTENQHASIRFRNWIDASTRPADSGVSTAPSQQRNSV